MNSTTPIPRTPSGLIEANNSLWHDATHHPFLEEIQGGRLSQGAFSTWLVQDYHFARQLLISQSLILSNALRSDYEVLIGGLVALESELAWFEENAEQFDLNLAQPLTATCRAYVDFLLALPHQPYVVQITSLWALERAYLDGWMTALPCEPRYQKFVEHWTTPAFHDYVGNLEAAVNTALEAASDAQRHVAQDYFRWVARYERDFWQMAFAGE
ncbi:MAG: TenA family transcriptional regulator [Candidatus Poribacteria bacterium]|nr:TenA family transcriptional regulator [Candidatus Poribacteria bacterium]